MITPNNYILVSAIKNLNPDAEFSLTSIDDIRWVEGTDPISKELIKAEIDKITPTINAIENRKREYPSIESLVVALYDADDKAEIDKKRAEIKKKYPKP
jgi:hypothetical protein